MKSIVILVIVTALILVSGTSCITVKSIHSIIENGAMIKIEDGQVIAVALEELSALQITIPSSLTIENIQLSDNLLGIVTTSESRTLVAVASPSQFSKGDMLFSFSFDSLDGVFEHEGWTIITRRPITTKEQLFSGLSNHDPVLIGDFDGNGQVDLDDFDEFGKRYGTVETHPRYDVVYDISSEDEAGYPRNAYSGVWNRFLDTPGDPDGLIGLDDFNFFAFNFGAVHPYTGNWTFEGELEERETAEYGKVSGSGSGTAEVTMSNHEFHVSVVADIEINTEKKGTIKFEIGMDSSSPELEFTFAGGEMTFSGALKIPGDDTQYIAVLQGILKQEGNNIYAQVKNGTIKLEGQAEVLGTWTAEKQ